VIFAAGVGMRSPDKVLKNTMRDGSANRNAADCFDRTFRAFGVLAKLRLRKKPMWTES
jgi:hypothetical protein